MSFKRLPAVSALLLRSATDGTDGMSSRLVDAQTFDELFEAF